jgi:transcriptional regulator with XRE-family HTH domain
MGTSRDDDDDQRTHDLDSWARLGRLIQDRRAELGLTQAEIQSVGGPSPATLYQLEAGHRGAYRAHILRRLERALGWGAGSVRSVLSGGLPLLDDEPGAARGLREEPPGVRRHRDWVASFRELPIEPRDKLKILSALLEETVAELGSGGHAGARTDPLATPGREALTNVPVPPSPLPLRPRNR